MRAVILAGGKGTRLRPFTTLIPKPLVPLGDKYSILEIIIMQLARAGFTRITVAVNHLSRLIMAYFGDGSRLGVELDYSLEDRELSTIRPLRKSLSAFTTRNDVAPGRCFCRTASAARIRSSKNAWFTSTRSGESTRTLIFDFEL